MSTFTVYKSSAGSGKTFNLVKNYLKIALADTSTPPQAFKHILAITFTNKAAGEMKQRVIETLRNLSDSDREEGMREPLCQELGFNAKQLATKSALLLNTILHRYSDFSIGTIDSFIHRLVRTFALDLRLPLNFTIETNRDIVLARCVDELAKKIGEDKLITQVLFEFSQSRVEENKNWHVEAEILSFAKKMLNEEGNKQLEKIRSLEVQEVMQAEKLMSRYINEFSKTLIDLASSALNQLVARGLCPKDFHYGKTGIWGYFEKITEKRFDDSVMGSRLRNGIENNKWLSAKSNAEEKDIEDIKHWLEELEEHRSKGKRKYYTYLVLLRNIYSLMVISEVEKLLFAIKQEENIVFISEFNRMIAAIVENEPAPFIYERIGEHYHHYLLDEFQDTSVLQWKNLLPLLDNSLGRGHFNLIVGDGKQSIYRWRGGEVKQFTELPKITGEKDAITLEREASLTRYFKEEILKVNYRSKQNIIDFNNEFYEYLKNEKLPKEFARVYDSSNQEGKKNNDGGYTSFDYLEDEKTNELSENKICKRIEEWIVLNTTTYGYQLSDITILVRSKKNGKLVADYLLSKNIPIVSNESLLLSKNNCINTLISLLHLVRDEKNPIHEANILNYLCNHHFFPNQTYQEILREMQRSHQTLFKFLSQQNILPCEREELNSLSLFNLCTRLIKEFRMNEHASVFIQFFMDELLKFSRKYQENLSAFLTWWEQHGSSCSAVLPEGTNAIRIMTIHAAKGLQFPVVIFPFADWDIIKHELIWVKSTEKEIPNIQAALVKMNGTLELTPFSTDYAIEKNKQILDNVNMFYVATTRPENHLHIISRKRKNSTYVDRWLNEFFTKWEKATPTNSGFGYGKMMPHIKKESTQISNELYPVQINWQELNTQQLLHVPTSAFQEKNEKEEKRKDGILFHLAMSRIYNKSDIPTVKQWLIAKGHCSIEKAHQLEAKLNSLFQNDFMKKLFHEDSHALNEPEIISGTETLRPDRIVFNESITKIIDYKTGAESSNYHEQLDKYAVALRNAGFTNTEKIIVYVEEEKIEVIPS